MRRILYFLLRRFRIFDILANQNKIISQYPTQLEILNALKFNSTIADSEWLKFKSFSPGGWAADYGLLYTLYRVVGSMKPQSILEFGLGQSSKILHQYANFYNVNAITCEHDENWVSFFLDGNDIKYPINISLQELQEIEYKGYKTLSYKNILNNFSNQKFDLIVVDAPFGSEHYSRSQIIDFAKHSLNKRFCIIIDDYERNGEQETFEELKKTLAENNISYTCTIYKSSKQHCLLCSKDLSFLTSL